MRAWEDLLTAFRGLPGVGPKMAERIALHLLRRREAAEELLKVLDAAGRRLARCPRCGDMIESEDDGAGWKSRKGTAENARRFDERTADGTGQDYRGGTDGAIQKFRDAVSDDAGQKYGAGTADGCRSCRDDSRDAAVLCVVEEIGDRQALERSRAFNGRYHVLGGVLSALDGVGPEDLKIDALLTRADEDGVKEVILATNPTAEGETTASYLADLLKARGLSVTRLAYGLPSGSVIQYADEFTLARALEGRGPSIDGTR